MRHNSSWDESKKNKNKFLKKPDFFTEEEMRHVSPIKMPIR